MKSRVLSPGTKTYYRGKVAYVICCINSDDPRDIALQGLRYYLDSAGLRWSVTENELRENRWG